MVESILIKINFHPSLYHLHQIRTRSPFHQFGIAPARHHESDIYSRQSRCSHGKEHGLRRQEIRTLHIHIPVSLQDDTYIALHDVRPRWNRAACHDLRKTIIGNTLIYRRIIAAVVDEFPAHEIPVHKECSLDGIDSTATDTEMRISPSLLCRSLHISHGNIHAPNKSHLSIDDTEFAMVAIVYLTRKGRKFNWHESLYTHSCLNHPFEEAVFHLPAPHIVVYQSYLHALTHLVYQRISHQIS